MVALLLVLTPGSATSWTPFPAPGPGGRVAVAPSLDGPMWEVARSCLGNLQRAAGAEYYAAVVPVTDAGGNPSPSANDAVPFVDALALTWPQLGERSILIGLGLSNRAVAIRPGPHWAGLGFERGTITRTIDNSTFKSHARAGDYPEAVCALARAVDRQLVTLANAAESARHRTQAKLDGLRQDFGQIAELQKKASRLDAGLGAMVTDKLQSAQGEVTRARELLATHPVEAEARANEARLSFDAAVAQIASYEQFVQRVPSWRKSVDSSRKAIAARPDSDWQSPVAATEQLNQCELMFTNFGARSIVPPEQVDACLAAAESHLEAADRSYFVWRTVVPSVVAGAIALFALALLIFMAVRRRRVEKLVEAELGRWSDALGTASERLLDLETEFSIYFDSGRKPWVGDSAELDQACADEVNRLFLMFSKAQDIHRAAQKAKEDAPILMTGALEGVLERLRTVEVTIEMGEREKRRRIFLPLSREYKASAAQLLEDLAGSYARAAELLEEATSLMERVDALRVAIAETSTKASSGIEHRATHGLPTEHLEQHARAGDADWLGGRATAATDPKQAVEYFENALEHLTECVRLCDLGNTAVDGVRDALPSRREELEARIAELRADGYAVREPGFDPDHELERLTRVGFSVVENLQASSDEPAHEIWVAIDKDLDALARALELTARAREGVPSRLAELEEQHAENNARVPDAAKILARLQKSHAQAAYDRESDNLDEIAQLRELTDEGFGSARQAHTAQHYLAARSDVEALAAMIGKRRALLDEVEAILKRLESARDTARELFGKAAKTLAETRSLCRSEKGITDELANAVQDTLSALRVARDLAAKDRPHWLELHSEAQRINMAANDQREDVAAEVAAYRIAQTEYKRLEAECVELLKRARRETRDRPHVEAMLVDAKKAIETAVHFTEHPGASGTKSVLEVNKAASWLDRAEKAWKSELAAIQSAEADLATAERRYQTVDGQNYGYSAYADASGALPHLRDARDARDAREWEKVKQHAAAALVAISAAEDYAQDEADRERRRREAEARRAAAAASSASYSSSSSSFSSSSSSFSSSSFSSSSSSGGSSYSSSSGGSSW